MAVCVFDFTTFTSMKKLITIALIFPALLAFSQEQFNVILEDTVSHIASNVVETNDGYTVLSGTNNENGIRCIGLSKVNFTGNVIEKKLLDNDSIEYWEGLRHCLKRFDSDTVYFSGTLKSGDGKSGIFVYKTNDQLTAQELYTYDFDTIWKASFNITFSQDALYITGQHYNQNTESAQLFILKSDFFGNSLWKRFYGNIYESGDQILLTSNNQIVIGGVTNQSLSSSSNWYVIKTDTAGNLIWEKNYGHGSRNDGAVKAIVETQDSCILACGSYPGIENISDTYYDGCIRKIDQNGELVWEKFYRDYAKLENPSIVLTTNTVSDIVFKGNEYYFLGSNRDHRSASRGYLMKTNQNGEILWRKIYYAIDTNTTYQWLNSFQITNDKGFILSGYGNEYDRQGYDPPQQRWLIKTDSMGMDGLCNTEPDALQVNIDIPDTVCRADTIPVQIHIAGKSAPYTLSFSTGQVIDSIYYPPTFVPQEIGLGLVEMESGGSVYHSEDITEATISNHEWGECIVKNVDFHTPAATGDHNIQITLTDTYGESITITRSLHVEYCHDNIVQENENPALRIYPNPATDKLHLQLANLTQTQHAKIYDASGKLVSTHPIHIKTTTLAISHLKPGNYILKIDGISKGFTVVR